VVQGIEKQKPFLI